MHLTGQVVLLAEGDAVIGDDHTDALERAGYQVLGPCLDTADALNLLELMTPDFAILDPLLRDGPCTALADELRRRGVPFLIHSAIPQAEVLSNAFRGAPRLTKPALVSDVILTLEDFALSATAPSPRGVAFAPAARDGEPEGGTTNPLVRKLAGFADLSQAERELLERISARPYMVPAHTDLIREGEKPKGVFLVMEGFASRHKIRADGRRQITAYLVPGDICDLDVALLGAMDHTITTLSACFVVRVEPDTVAELMDHPQVARALRMTTLVDEATLREWVVNVGCRSAVERIAHLFCELHLRMQAVGLATGDSFELPITQADLADTAGLSAVHVNRSLQELRRRGLIEFRSKRLRILNLHGLRTIAEFKEDYLHLGARVAA